MRGLNAAECGVRWVEQSSKACAAGAAVVALYPKRHRKISRQCAGVGTLLSLHEMPSARAPSTILGIDSSECGWLSPCPAPKRCTEHRQLHIALAAENSSRARSHEKKRLLLLVAHLVKCERLSPLPAATTTHRRSRGVASLVSSQLC